MFKISQSKSFKKDVKRARKRGKDLLKLELVVLQLAENKELPSQFRDHILKGNYSNHRECHIEPDWLLIYRIEPNHLILVRTGTHADLFAK